MHQKVKQIGYGNIHASFFFIDSQDCLVCLFPRASSSLQDITQESDEDWHEPGLLPVNDKNQNSTSLGKWDTVAMS